MPHDTLDARVEQVARACELWRQRPDQFQRAVDATCDGFSYSRSAVEQQLLNVARLTPQIICEVLADELGDIRLLEGSVEHEVGGTVRVRRAVVPDEILHLASSTVPGLSVQGLLWGLVLGSHNQVRPSTDDAVIGNFKHMLDEHFPQLGSRVELVGEVRWASCDAALVHGSDETIRLVRDRLGETAPVAAFGTRTSAALITTAGSAAKPDWHQELRNDLHWFDGNGCMTPAVIVLVGDVDLQAVGAKLDVPVLAALDAGELAPLLEQVRRPQTLAVMCAPEERGHIEHVAAAAGFTRVCDLGRAHQPPATLRHDGRGVVIDLVRFAEAERAAASASS